MHAAKMHCITQEINAALGFCNVARCTALHTPSWCSDSGSEHLSSLQVKAAGNTARNDEATRSAAQVMAAQSSAKQKPPKEEKQQEAYSTTLLRLLPIL